MRATEFIVEYNNSSTEQFRGVDMTLEKNQGTITVKALDDQGNVMGEVTFDMLHKNQIEADLVWVEEQFRGKGIAKLMYDFTKSRGYEIHKSDNLTQIDDHGKQSGEYFWLKNRIGNVWENAVLTELFQPGKKWEWSRLGTNEVSAYFKVGKRDYIWQAFTSRGNPKKWEIQFRLMRDYENDPAELDLYGTTGTGNSAEVMSTAVDITRAFLKDYGLDIIEEITFNAKEDSRIGLYAKMIKRLLPDWDLHSKKDSVDGMVFTLTDRRAYDKPENKLTTNTP